MIPKECKRLAEVDFPIAVVSRHAVREKLIRHGHPSTLHLWWARRPLASSRAVLLALLWPDPCDPLCPPKFKTEARKRLREVPGCNAGATDEGLRQALLQFIADFANWDHAAQPTYLEVSRALTKAAHVPADESSYEPPLVVDSFAGGGSIPFEALRLGCATFASDLNPVACLVLKVLLEDIPRNGPQLADDLRRFGTMIKKQAEQQLADLYPSDPDGATPIAYLWARTVCCESPNCGAEIPLVRSFWLSKKATRMRALRHRVVRPRNGLPHVEFEIFEPTAERQTPGGTVTRAKATCLACGVVLPAERVRAQLVTQRGGADVVFEAGGRRTGGARMLAVVTIRPNEQGRHFRLPNERDYAAVREAQDRVSHIVDQWGLGARRGANPIPDEPIHAEDTRSFWVTRYGPRKFGDLFTARQIVALVTYANLIKSADAAQIPLALLLSRLANGSSSACRWNPNPSGFAEKIEATFARQGIPIVWDFAETSPVAGTSGNWEGALNWVMKTVEYANSTLIAPGVVSLADATEHPLPDETANVWFVDPPYYDAVPYADLSDYFFVWLKRALPELPLLHDPYDLNNPLTPKVREAVQNERSLDAENRAKDGRFYENTMARAFAEGRRILREDGIAAVVFAHKTTEGWEALLSGMIRGGWTITGSWPIATEMGGRLRARDSAALATSIHLVCRPRSDGAPIGDWADVLRELPTRVTDWMGRLQQEGVRGADLVFACIGPALEIFSRFSKVETAEGREVKLDEYLTKVWEVVGRSALSQVLGTVEAQTRARIGTVGTIEEDARLTALFLWTLQATEGEEMETATEAGQEQEAERDEDDEGGGGGPTKGYTLAFDVVRRFAQPLGIELPKWEGRVIETKKGVVRLLPIAERAKQLFGEDGTSAVATRLEQDSALGTVSLQGVLFPEAETAPRVRGRGGRGRRASVEVGDENLAAAREATTLDRVHAAMLLQSSGRANALRALLKAEQERGPDFLRLANALSALYPKASEEKRLLDAMLLAVPR